GPKGKGMTFPRRAWCLAFILTSISSLQAKEPLQAEKVWVVVKPHQCLSNRWEKDWLSKHNNKGTLYPMKKEGDVIKDYFRSKDILIQELRMLKYVNGDPRCEACDCPRGDTLYLLVKAQDVPRMVKLGYTERLPANVAPEKK